MYRHLVKHIPKAELHIHLEGALTPDMAKMFGQKNGIEIPARLMGSDNNFHFTDYYDFMKNYDVIASVIKTTENYADLTFDYLKRAHEERVVYVELTLSPDHARDNGLSYDSMLEGVVSGIDRAYDAFGIMARILMVFVRHNGAARALEVAHMITTNMHPYVVGVTMAGVETSLSAHDVAPAFELAHNAGLHCTAHLGEICGPDVIWDGLKYLPLERIGHGIHAVFDKALLRELKQRNIMLEICPTSNTLTGDWTYETYYTDIFSKLLKADVEISLNSDDPTFFATSIGNEYGIAKKYFNQSDEQLIAITRAAIQHSFIDEHNKQLLLKLVA